ncbi:MAG: urease accessory protein UreF [Actinomycetota bacterium]
MNAEPGAAALAVLLLADGRFPAGGHAHSAGVEAAVADGRVHDAASLEDYVRGRLWTAGLTDAALAAATAVHLAQWEGAAAGAAVLAALDAEAEARVPAPALRASSRRLGAQLVRAAGRCWPAQVLLAAARLDPPPHQPVALGVVTVAVGAGPEAAATLAVHAALTTPAQAAVRLLGLDPFTAAAVVAGLAREGRAVVAEALAAAEGPLRDLPCSTGPLVDIAAVHHAASDRRLFVT